VGSREISAAAAGTWRLGDLTVNRLGFGAMRLTGSLPFEKGAPSDRDRSIAVLRRAVELGVNHIDTAAFYFSPLRSANELINTALAPYPDDLVIVTKVWPGRDPWGDWYTARPDQLRGQVEENLRQLGRDHLDVVNLRRRSQPASIAEHFGALAELRDAGLIRHLGVSDVRWRGGTGRRPRRSAWRGPCTRRRTSSPSPAPATRPTWRRTWPPRRCGCPPTTWRCSTRRTPRPRRRQPLDDTQ